MSGAHALGRCHSSRSGFEGPWTFSPTTVTNDYYKLLFDEKWVWKKWNGPKQLEDKKTQSLMMLPYVPTAYGGISISRCADLVALSSTDYVLTQDKSFKKYAKAYADNQDLWFKEYVPLWICQTSSAHVLTSNSFSFANVVSRLFELGVPTAQFVSSDPWIMKNSDEN